MCLPLGCLNVRLLETGVETICPKCWRKEMVSYPSLEDWVKRKVSNELDEGEFESLMRAIKAVAEGTEGIEEEPGDDDDPPKIA